MSITTSSRSSRHRGEEGAEAEAAASSTAVAEEEAVEPEEGRTELRREHRLPSPPRIGELVLMMGNVTSAPGGGFQSSLIYTNLYAYALTCEVLLEASWLSTATNVTLYINSVPQPVFDYGVSPTLITVWSGIINVSSGSSVSFSATYHVQSMFSFYGTLFYLGSTPVNIWNIIAVGGLVTVAFVLWWDVRNPERSRLQEGLIGTALISLFAIAVVTL